MTGIWKKLEKNHAAAQGRTILSLFNDPYRFDGFSAEVDGMLLDVSKTNIDKDALSLLVDLAIMAGVAEKRDAMFAGDKINSTEDRAVFHTALRADDTTPLMVDVLPGIAETLRPLDLRRTLIIVSTKTFTTIETMTHAATAIGWLRWCAGEDIGAHLAAVSTAPDKTAAMGIAPDRVFGFADWVGGRYSLWGPVGSPVFALGGLDCSNLRSVGCLTVSLSLTEILRVARAVTCSPKGPRPM